MAESKFTKEQMAARLVEAKKEKADLEAKLKPIMDELTAEALKVQAAQKAMKAKKDKLLPKKKELVSPLMEVSSEITMLINATGGKGLRINTPDAR